MAIISNAFLSFDIHLFVEFSKQVELDFGVVIVIINRQLFINTLRNDLTMSQHFYYCILVYFVVKLRPPLNDCPNAIPKEIAKQQWKSFTNFAANPRMKWKKIQFFCFTRKNQQPICTCTVDGIANTCDINVVKCSDSSSTHSHRRFRRILFCC